MKLTKAIPIDASKQPVALPAPDAVLNIIGLALVTGWGSTQNANESSLILRGAVIPIGDPSVCNGAYAVFGGLTDQMLCAGPIEGGKDGIFFPRFFFFLRHFYYISLTFWFSMSRRQWWTTC